MAALYNKGDIMQDLQENSQQSIQQQSVQQDCQDEKRSEDVSSQDSFQDEKQSDSEQKVQEEKIKQLPKKSNGDRIAELESKIAKMEAVYQLQGQNVVDLEVCTDLLLKGYTLDQLKRSKPYLFNNNQQNQSSIKPQQKIVSETQMPKSQPQAQNQQSDGFIKSLASMLVSKFQP